ncbi:MAG: LCP family protein [Peptostreptococcaceae bacterium]
MNKSFKIYIVILVLCMLLCVSSIKSYCNDKYEYIHGLNNLLLIGKNDISKYHSNFFIVLTIDSIDKKLILTSLNKNTFIPEYNSTLYELYLSNDENLLISIIKNHFDINIDNHVVINENALRKIIDSTGTVKLNSKSASGDDILDFLEDKKYSNNYEQEKAQVYVIQELLYGFSVLPFSMYPYVIKESFPYVKLDITPFKMLSLGFTALSLKNYTADQKYL